ncbi:DNA polymerase III subunit gamma and tau [Microbispora sp. RL4-1S]|uniref:DNA polymerase III subunit gamma/tau n=1 Tax=Microbispora oryzae TaxID=2806554 RepID=A0A941AJ56_9ACTN|nr:DNA polymerase III subunit gamma and tau [Microbispora oryzae]MBP2704607.1 DNA polymerase III subunit gamma and tau [Microbispora oryzae]
MSLALYRKYRPGTFAEVKGQEHVTEPLRQALRSGRINHAYLFSGPRGCGKTSSARILARSLNCEKGPTPDPCGECDSCVALAPTGPGHLDVIEIDAASHGGVDDARDLRERAFFAPVSARFKIYIIDEAHMVTREGFNALLKLVEEPPPHLKFVFATTEPEKVIGTIKSRTHHYPFRLMPPATLRQLMEEILQSESVPYESAALPLVVRAGAGSARDTLSILDQLLAGADDAGITYQRAVSLLGYTDGDLLDEVVGAFAARDGAAVFHAVNRVIEGGHDPRRFATDLLERFRDLVILANVPEAAGSGLLDRPADELERLVAQAASMGPAELTRAAEVFNAGLTEMRGATSPRLLLELMCARVLLPAAEKGEAALLARLERVERGIPAGGQAPVIAAAVPAVSPIAAPVPAQAAPPTTPPTAPPTTPPSTGPSPSLGAAGGPAMSPAPSAGPASAAADDWPETVKPGAPASRPAAAPATSAAPAAPAAPTAGTGPVQQAWPQVLEAIKGRQRVAWMILNAQGRLLGVEGNVVTVGFEKPGDVQGFLKGKRDEVVAAALGDVLGGTWRVDVVVGGSGPGPAGPSARGPAGPAPSAPPRGPAGAPQGGPAPGVPAPGPSAGPSGTGGAETPAGGPAANGTHDSGAGMDPAPSTTATAHAAVVVTAPQQAEGGSASAARTSGEPTDESWPDAPSDDFDSPSPGPGGSGFGGSGFGPAVSRGPGPGQAAARSAARAAQTGGSRAAWPETVPSRRGSGGDFDEVDPLNDAGASGLTGMALIQRELGGRIIEEIDHS